MWSVVPTKIPSDILKFQGKNGEGHRDNVTNFHLWCSSNSLNHDSIRLQLFQHTLTGSAEKWYIQFCGGIYQTCNDLSMNFLNYFQLPVHYNAGTDLLLIFRQDKAMHIFDHIQEWRKRNRLIKANIPPKFLLEWFLKYLFSYIKKDVLKYIVMNEEHVIL